MRFSALALVPVLVGCVYSPRFLPNQTHCSPNGACPSPLVCDPSTRFCASADAAPDASDQPADGPAGVDGPPDLPADAPPPIDAPPDVPADSPSDLLPDLPPDAPADGRTDGSGCRSDLDCYAGPGTVCLGLQEYGVCATVAPGCVMVTATFSCTFDRPCTNPPPNSRCTPTASVDAQ